ncbi:hypothetical protein KKC65_00635 [Patescibacteria group bacterium]|nr:hypothetical protein [Patescibacteria group bacterium]
MEIKFILMFEILLDKIKKEAARTPYYEIKLPFLVVLILILFGIIFWSLNLFWIFQDLILLATFGTLFWYSLETRQLKNVARTTNELQQLPFFVLIYKEDNNLTLKNEGKGMAYNITIDPIKIDNKTFIFGEQWYYCNSGGEKVLPFKIDNVNGSTKYNTPIKEFLFSIYEHTLNKKAEFTIRFNSPLKNRHYQTIILKVPNDLANIENIEIYNFN